MAADENRVNIPKKGSRPKSWEKIDAPSDTFLKVEGLYGSFRQG